ncbi:tetratricopeptide repeat protein [candidate division KSB1 bacterium]|nr:tetratricopeptide repeat protein [candidate division KSB1 bacterium]
MKKLIFFILFFISVAYNQESDLVQAIIRETGQDLEKLSRLIQEHELLLNNYPDGDFSSTILFQLAELYERKAELKFQNEMAEYERELAQFDKGEIAQEPIMPRITFSETQRHCERIIEEYPSVGFKDKVLYKLAMTHLQEGNLAKAKDYFNEIIIHFPNSSINLESHFRIGEFYFDKRDFKNAIKHFSVLLGKWDNPYFDLALYKLGWSYYNVNDYSNAISTFVYLLEDLMHLDKVDSKTIGKTKADLETESIQYIASCFTEYGGPQEALKFLLPRKDKMYSLPILKQMAELYQNRNYYDEAIRTNLTILEIYPMFKYAPQIYQGIVDNYELDGQIKEANDARRKAIELYGPASEWAHGYRDTEYADKADSLSRQYMSYLGKFYQAKAQESNQVKDYQEAVQFYKLYLKEFPFHSDAAEINYLLAESLYEQGAFKDAAEAYHKVVVKYDSTQYRQDAAYNRILCYYQILGTDRKMDSTSVYIEEFLGTGDVLTAKLTHESEIELLRACNDFTRYFQDSHYYDQVLMKFGETLHELDLFYPSVKVYKKVVDIGPQGRYYLAAKLNAGRALYESGYYTQTEEWLDEIVVDFKDSTEYVDKANKLIASARFKIAEELSEKGNFKDAANVLESVVTTSTDPQFQERALYAAAAQFQKSGQITQAALALEKLAQDFPSAELADESLYSAAGFREQNSEWALAAMDYLRLYETYPGSKHAPRALKNAAMCYENIEDWLAAKKIYGKYANAFPENVQEVIECLYKSGEMSYKSGDFSQAEKDFQQTLDAFHYESSKGKFIDNYFAAQAQFMLGEIYYRDFANIELLPPFRENLKRKRDLLAKVLNTYKEALEFQVADWSTAASYKIGMAFEELVRAFMESPIPSGLSPEQSDAYTRNLAESTKTYKQSALKTYQRVVEQAEINQIENTWVTQSRERIDILEKELDTANMETVPVKENLQGSGS